MLLRAMGRLYGFSLPVTLVAALKAHNNSIAAYLHWFWHTKTFKVNKQPLGAYGQAMAWALALGILYQLIFGVVLLIDWARFGTVGAWQFGLALLAAYPLVWAHVLVVAVLAWRLVYYILHPKKAGRAFVCLILERQVKKLRRRHHITVVAVAGSIGKTSTKLAIAELLGQTKRVRYETGNYNDRVTVPLIFFGEREPNMFNVFAWIYLFGANIITAAHPYPYDVVVVELGTDGPGFMKEFAYLCPDITVLTAITPEHMQYFKTLDAVAEEELAVFKYSKRVLVNGDDIAGTYLAGREFTEYSIQSHEATYYAKVGHTTQTGQNLPLSLVGKKTTVHTQYVGAQGAKTALAAAAVADMLGVSPDEIADGMPKLAACAGRMQLLSGKKESMLLDDTYNASPVAVTAALDVLYEMKARQRIAMLGSMNELGNYSPEAHRIVGQYCDPKKLDLVVTIGKDAHDYLAPEAEAKGCTVKTFVSPYEAGTYVLEQMQTGSLVLAEGSQNGIFAEEAIKQLLASPTDASKLVRQSAYWMLKKQKQFTDSESV